MDVIKVAKTPGTIGPVITDPHNPKWPTIISEGDGIGIKELSIDGPVDPNIDPTETISQQDWFGGWDPRDPDDPGPFGPSIIKHLEGGGSDYITDEDTTGLIDDGSGWVIRAEKQIDIVGGWEDYVPSGWPKPTPEPEKGGDSDGIITDGTGWGIRADKVLFGGWEDYVLTGWPKPKPTPEGGPPDGKIEGDYGFSGDTEARGDTNIPKHEVPKHGDDQYDARSGDWGTIRWGSGDWGFKGDDDGAEELFNIGGGTGVSGITKTGGIILKVADVKPLKDGSSWFSSTEYGGRIPVIWKSDPVFFSGHTSTFSGEGLLIDGDFYIDGGTESLIDGGSQLGHTCPFVTPGFDGMGEKDFGVQPRT